MRTGKVPDQICSTLESLKRGGVVQAWQGELLIPSQNIPIANRSQRVKEAIDHLATGEGAVARGAIFTKPEVVEFILDLSNCIVARDLTELRFLEPSFGGGDFLLPIIKRIFASWRASKGRNPTRKELENSIAGFELHKLTFEKTKLKVLNLLIKEGLTDADALQLVDQWLHHDDFLLAPIQEAFDFVLGNPPYVRQELIPSALLREYRLRFKTLYDRADIYIPFTERSLSLLGPGGVLGFICADRWMKNKYGGPLRKMISESFHFRVYVDMVDTQAFQADVIAYPAITIISNDQPGSTKIAKNPTISTEALARLALQLASDENKSSNHIYTAKDVALDSQPWLLGDSTQIGIIRKLEAEFPVLEDSGCKVGIGVATGADRAFIADFDKLDVENDRKLRLVRTKDISGGEVNWLGKGIINPFCDSGGLVDLSLYPRLNKYLEERKPIISARHCAQMNPKNWYKTIDRITPSLLTKPKLLIPDIKGESHIVYESGLYYPHHNLYYVTSAQWDLRCLQAILMSSLTRAFISIYSTKMRGGFMRFQAQYLRRIRVPAWSDISETMKSELSEAAVNRDVDACNEAVCKLYELDIDELIALHESTIK
jgi:hypothetical protein